MNTNFKLLTEAKKRGFYCGDTKYNTLFSELFFGGGTLDFKEDLDGEFKDKSLTYLKMFMQSYSPKHEEKEAISAMILSELVNEPVNA
jgi:hypothetical protein